MCIVCYDACVTKVVFALYIPKWKMKGYFCVDKALAVFVPRMGYTGEGLVSSKTENT